ncbi:MAG: NosD domain-containing protein [Thermoproteota archaeon]
MKVRNVKIQGFTAGIHLHDSSKNKISENNVEKNEWGIFLSDSSNNRIIVP